MFDILTERLNAVFRRLGSKGRLTEKDVDEALREVRLALLEADVHFKVVKDFVARVRERSLGTQVLQGLNPGQQVVKIVHDELTAILKAGEHGLRPSSVTPSILMLVGLQGSGKTTTAAKLALHLRRLGQSSLLIAADLRRPAAVDQLVTLGKQLAIPVYHEDPSSTTMKVAQGGLQKAQELGVHWALVDTGGRLHIDQALMDELRHIKEALQPSETLLVVDAMTGQDAVRSAQEFHQEVNLTGLVLTKLDGDARGGAALSITAVTGIPIKFMGMGEKADALEAFHPDRLASRILGMGDVLSLIEKAQETFDQKQAQEMERKLRRAEFTLEDLLTQLQQLRKMGPLSSILEMMPGFSAMKSRVPLQELDEKQLKRVEAIVHSMTPKERRNPEVIDGSRKRRIAKGSGTSVPEVNTLLNQFREVQKIMKRMSALKGKGPLRIPGF
ncbi:MAG: signal recognition particle protein [Chloroflexi bacterium]|nr:signal recognition particle protein [Chloroflexota bacterium]